MADSKVAVLLDFQSKLAGIQSATTGLANLAKGIIGAAGAYVSFRAALRGGNEILKLTADLQHLRVQSGLGVSAALKYRQALTDNGVAADKLGQSVAKMSKTIVDAARGQGSGVTAFEQAGLDVQALLALDPSAQFDAIGRALARIENPTLAAATAMGIFGESGAALLTVFRGSDLADVESSLGKLPEILERNAEIFERIDTLLGRVGNRSRQFFAGFLDQVGSHVREPLEAVDKVDFVNVGQRLGAFASIAIDSWKAGKFPDFLALSIEAGVETGIEASKTVLRGLVDLVSGPGFWSGLTNIVATFGISVGKTLITMLVEPVAFLRAMFLWLRDQSDALFANLRNQLAGLYDRLAKIPGIGRVYKAIADDLRTAVPEVRAFNDLWDTSRQKVEAGAKAITDWLDEQLRLTRKIIGVEKDGDKARITAGERLKQLIEAQLALRDRLAAQLASPRRAFSTTPPSGADSPPEPDRDVYRPLDRNSFPDQIAAALERLPTLAESAGNALSSFIGGATNSLAAGFEALLNKTMTLGQALRSIAAGFGQSMLRALARMGAEMTINAALMVAKHAWAKGQMFLIDRLTAAKSLALTVANASKSLASWIPSAIAASISSYGVAATIGLAAALAAIAAGVAGGFKDGGYTGSGNAAAIAGAVHRGEFVFSVPAVNAIGLETLDAVHNAARRGSYAGAPAAAAFIAGTAAPVSAAPVNVSLALVNFQSEMRRFQQQEGNRMAFDYATQRTYRV